MNTNIDPNIAHAGAALQRRIEQKVDARLDRAAGAAKNAARSAYVRELASLVGANVEAMIDSVDLEHSAIIAKARQVMIANEIRRVTEALFNDAPQLTLEPMGDQR